MSTNHLHEDLGPGLLQEVAPNVFSYVQPDGTWFINNTGFIIGDSGVVSIDTTSTELRNRAYIDAIASVTSQPVKILVNTHHHADHTHGNYLFPEATIISHASCRDVMLATGIPDYRAAFPTVAWGDLKFRAPDITFEGSTTIHLDDITIDLFDLGFVAHTGRGRLSLASRQRSPFCRRSNFSRWNSVCALRISTRNTRRIGCHRTSRSGGNSARSWSSVLWLTNQRRFRQPAHIPELRTANSRRGNSRWPNTR